MSDHSRTIAAATNPIAAATTEVVTVAARSAAAEVAGGKPLGAAARRAVADAADTLDRRAPGLADDAGIVNWRYALLGWVTWQVGKRIVRRKAKAAVARLMPSHDDAEE
jgi:hypothetical protein